MNQEKISQLIKKIRTDNNLTQSQFANKYNVTYQAVSKWENGKNLPDITLLTQICRDFEIDINDFLEGNTTTKKHNKNLIYVVLLIAFIAILLIVLVIRKDNNFEFKTISSNCPSFTISGSLAYNKNKSYLYISNIEYCGGDDNNYYENIECTLSERKNNIETIIGKDTYDNDKPIQLEEFLHNIEFRLDDFSNQCKNYSSNSLFLEIKATNEDGKTTIYKVPLSLNSHCLK